MLRYPLGATAGPLPERVMVLQQQMNRYKSPEGTKLLGSAFPGVAVDGVLSFTTAMLAASILAKRAKDAFLQFGDRTAIMADTYGKVWLEASARVSTPLPYVADHLEEVIVVVSMLADNHGLPGASGDALRRFVTDKRVWVAAALAVGGYFLFVRKRRGRR